MGIAPTVLWGRASRTVQTDLGTWTTPAWLDIDQLLLDLWHEWEDGLCPGCGDPLESHAGKTYRDYTSAVITCPAVIALDNAQVEAAKRDGHKDAKRDPSRARSWLMGPRGRIRETGAYIRELLTPKEG